MNGKRKTLVMSFISWFIYSENLRDENKANSERLEKSKQRINKKR